MDRIELAEGRRDSSGSEMALIARCDVAICVCAEGTTVTTVKVWEAVIYRTFDMSKNSLRGFRWPINSRCKCTE